MFKKYTHRGFRRAIDKEDIERIKEYLSHEKVDQFLNRSYSDGVYDGYTYSYSPINYAIHKRALASLKTLIESDKVDPSAQQTDGSYPLTVALRKKSEACIDIIENAIKDVNDLNKGDYLSDAVSNNNFPFFKKILSRGADINKQDCNGNTPLHISLFTDRKGFSHFILQQDVRTDLRNMAGVTAEILMKDKNTHPAPTSMDSDDSDTWKVLNNTMIAHIQTLSVIDRKITEIFNFESGKRMLITENLKTQTESTTPMETFLPMDQNTIFEQFEKYCEKNKGAVPEEIKFNISAMLKNKPEKKVVM